MSFIIGIFAVIGVLTTAVAIAMGIVAAFDTRALRRPPSELEQRRALVEALRGGEMEPQSFRFVQRIDNAASGYHFDHDAGRFVADDGGAS